MLDEHIHTKTYLSRHQVNEITQPCWPKQKTECVWTGLLQCARNQQSFSWHRPLLSRRVQPLKEFNHNVSASHIEHVCFECLKYTDNMQACGNRHSRAHRNWLWANSERLFKVHYRDCILPRRRRTSQEIDQSHISPTNCWFGKRKSWLAGTLEWRLWCSNSGKHFGLTNQLVCAPRPLPSIWGMLFTFNRQEDVLTCPQYHLTHLDGSDKIQTSHQPRQTTHHDQHSCDLKPSYLWCHSTRYLHGHDTASETCSDNVLMLWFGACTWYCTQVQTSSCRSHTHTLLQITPHCSYGLWYSFCPSCRSSCKLQPTLPQQ